MRGIFANANADRVVEKLMEYLVASTFIAALAALPPMMRIQL
jgi:hypothetical protein